jgi:hypothetical protein
MPHIELILEQLIGKVAQLKKPVEIVEKFTKLERLGIIELIIAPVNAPMHLNQ